MTLAVKENEPSTTAQENQSTRSRSPGRQDNEIEQAEEPDNQGTTVNETSKHGCSEEFENMTIEGNDNEPTATAKEIQESSHLSSGLEDGEIREVEEPEGQANKVKKTTDQDRSEDLDSNINSEQEEDLIMDIDPEVVIVGSNINPDVLDDEDLDIGVEQNDLVVPEIDITNYRTINCHININNIEIPEFTARQTNADHVNFLDGRLDRNKFIQSMGVISVSFKTSDDVTIENGIIKCKVVIIDGMHRLMVFRRFLQKAGLIDYWKTLFNHFPVTIWYPKDEMAPLTKMEIIGLAELLNESSSSVRPMSFQDIIYSTVSILKTINSEGKDVASFSIASVAKCLSMLNRMRTSHKRTKERYAMVAQCMFKFPSIFEQFLEITTSNSAISISHLSSSTLLKSSDEEFIRLCLKCISKRMNVQQQVDFKVIRESFYGCISEMYNELERECTAKGVELKQVLESSVSIGNDNEITIVGFICNRLQRFGSNKKVKNVEAATKQRITELMKKVKPIIDSLVTTETTSKTIQPNVEGDVGNDAPVDGVDGENEETNQEDVIDVDKEKEAETVEKEKSGTKTRRSTRNKNKVQADEDDDFEEEEIAPPRKKRKPNNYKSSLESVKNFIRGQDTTSICEMLKELGFSAVPLGNVTSTGKSRVSRAPDIMDLEEEGDQSESEDSMGVGEEDEFDDVVPAELPFGVNPEEGNREEIYGRHENASNDISHPIEPAYTIKETDQFQDLKLKQLTHKHRYLNNCCIPQQHRAHVLLSTEELIKNHCQVWWLLNQEYVSNLSRETVHKLLIGRLPNYIPGLVSQDNVTFSRMLMGNVEGMLAHKKTEINLTGYTVFPGMFDDVNCHPLEANYWISQEKPEETDVFKICQPVFGVNGNGLDNLMKHYEQSFEEHLRRGGTNWRHILNENVAADARQNEKSIGRYQQTRTGAMEELERSTETIKHAKTRAMCDVRVGMLLSMMKLSDQTRKETAMYCPDTGNRCLASTVGVARQVIHTDRATMGMKRTVIDLENPGYFSIITGDQPAYLWVVDGSHYHIAKARSNQLHALGIGSTAEKKLIPPHSLYIGRGDVMHAGAGFEDYDVFDGNQLRIHSLFYPARETFPNAIHIIKEYRPRFAKGGEYSDLSEEDNEAVEETPEKEASGQSEEVDEEEEEDIEPIASVEIEKEVAHTLDKTTGNEEGVDEEEDKTSEEEEEDEIRPVRRKTISKPQQKKNRARQSVSGDVVEVKVHDKGKKKHAELIMKVKQENTEKAEYKRRKARVTYGTWNASSTVDLDESENVTKKPRRTPRRK